MPRERLGETSLSARRGGVGLRTKLLSLLLAFGAIPLAASITIGYVVSRAIIMEQAERALGELAQRQTVHLSSELARQRLLLRTITRQLPPAGRLRYEQPGALAQLLKQSLLEGGVFDGLRLVGVDGRVMGSVALSDADPRWPLRAPAADWSSHSIVVHREGGRVVASVIAVSIGEGDQQLWLEGHVRAEAFGRLFAMQTHLMGEVESAIFERTGAPVLVAHEHAATDLAAAFARVDSVALVRVDVRGTPSLVATGPIAGSDWVFAAALPIDIALAPLARLRNSAVVGAGVLVLLIVVTGVLAAGSVTTPVHALAAVARRFGRGGTYQPVRRRTRDEIGELVQSFNRMARDLERSREEIDRLHAQEMERAQQLATVGELASGVAHEIRNPVTGVLGVLELTLQKLSENDPSRPLLEEAQEQLRRIEATTTQLLRYARPPDLQKVVVDANLLVERAARVVESQARSAHIDVRIAPAAEPVRVLVDPGLMVQVLVNLMLNGIEAMQPGGKLTVWVTRRAPEVWIGVRDTGPGVRSEARSEIFRPFYTTKNQGTGLGLSISHQIVTYHRGSLRIEDTPGGGATFVTTLPLVDSKGASDA